MEKTQIVYLVSSLRTGGAQTGLRRLARNLDPDSYDLTIVAINAGIENPQGWVPDHCKVLDLRISSIPKLYRAWTLWRELEGVDVLVCSLMEASLIGRILGYLHSTPRIVDWRHNSSFKNLRVRLLFNATAWIPDVIIADSMRVLEAVVDEPGVISTPVRYVPIAGIDTDEFKPADNRRYTADITIASVMRLTEQKNPHAMVELAKRFDDSSVKFEIAGDGPLLEELRMRVRESDLENIRFRGFVEDLPSFLSEADIYVQPSKSEGLCITVPEAMACELPVVASAVGGIPESVVDGETGYLLPPSNLDAFEERIRYLLERPDKRNALGKSGRKRVCEMYSIVSFVESFEEVVTP